MDIKYVKNLFVLSKILVERSVYTKKTVSGDFYKFGYVTFSESYKTKEKKVSYETKIISYDCEISRIISNALETYVTSVCNSESSDLLAELDKREGVFKTFLKQFSPEPSTAFKDTETLTAAELETEFINSFITSFLYRLTMTISKELTAQENQDYLINELIFILEERTKTCSDYFDEYIDKTKKIDEWLETLASFVTSDGMIDLYKNIF